MWQLVRLRSTVPGRPPRRQATSVARPAKPHARPSPLLAVRRWQSCRSLCAEGGESGKCNGDLLQRSAGKSSRAIAWRWLTREPREAEFKVRAARLRTSEKQARKESSAEGPRFMIIIPPSVIPGCCASLTKPCALSPNVKYKLGNGRETNPGSHSGNPHSRFVHRHSSVHSRSAFLRAHVLWTLTRGLRLVWADSEAVPSTATNERQLFIRTIHGLKGREVSMEDRVTSSAINGRKLAPHGSDSPRTMEKLLCSSPVPTAKGRGTEAAPQSPKANIQCNYHKSTL